MSNKLIKFPHQLKASREAMADPGICVYVDNSNIFIGGQNFAQNKVGEDGMGFRLHFENFMKLVRNGRPVREAVWGGSIPPPTDSVWRFLRELNVTPDLIPRAESGENETVDHKLQLLMHRHVRKYRDKPGTLAICTGDGKGYFKEEGYLYDLEGFVDDGWKIEVYSWTHCCHTDLQRFAKSRGKYIALEKFYDSITFVQNGRRVAPVDFDHLIL